MSLIVPPICHLATRCATQSDQNARGSLAALDFYSQAGRLHRRAARFSAIFVILSSMLAFLLTSNKAFARENNHADAIALLKRCLQSQETTNRISMRLITEGSGDNERIRYRMEETIRRDGDQLSIAGRCVYLSQAHQDGSANLRYISNGEYQLNYQWKITDTKPPNWGIFTKKRRLNVIARADHSWPLDGYFPDVRPIKRIAELLLEDEDCQTRGQEMIDNMNCQVIVGRNSYGDFTLWLSDKEGCLPRKIAHKKTANDLSGGDDNKHLSEGKFSEVGYSGLYWWIEKKLILDDVRFAKMGENFVPISGRLTRLSTDNEQKVFRSVFTYKRSEIEINPESGSDAFKADLPDGATLRDEDNPDSGVEYEWRNGKIVAAYAEFTGTAEGHWPQRSMFWIATWLVGGLLLLVFALVYIWRYKWKGS